MEFEDKIKNKLLMRGFPNEKLLNNRGLIGATIDEVILMTVKKLAIPDVSQQRELLKKWWKYFDEESVAVNCNDEEREEVINNFFNHI